MGSIAKFGDGYAKILEQSVLSVSRAYTAIWKKESIDLTELARKRWIERWTMDRIAAHFGCGRTIVVKYLRVLRHDPELIQKGAC
jgi:hypothetical protein